MQHRGHAKEERDDLAAVWTAARAAAADPGVADDVTVAVLVRARLWRRRGTPLSRRRLVTDAVREAVALSPAPPFDRVAALEREAIALARCARPSVDEIATALGVDAPVVRAAMRDGLRVIADASPPPDGELRLVA